MAAPAQAANIDELLSAIEKSGLLSADALAKVRESAAALADPKALARALIKDGTLTRWQADQLLHNYHRLVIGKYKLLDQLQASPTGRVYLAEHVQMGRRHTLKVLAKRLATNADAVARFLKGAQHACGLDHKNVSHVYDVSQDRLGHYVVMEYVEGQSLEQLVEKTGPLRLPQALDFISQAAEGLVHAHSHGVVHGDLKPANLVRDNNGVVKILEIGQDGLGAKPETADADESVEMASLAAVIFQAPEIRGDGEWADVACDVYSLGSVLCFLLTGKAAKNATVAVQHLEATADIPTDIVSIVQRLMADNPADRPRSLPDIVTALVAAVEPAAAAVTPPADETTKAAKKKKDQKPPTDAPPEIPAPPPAEAASSLPVPPAFVVSGQAAVVPVPPPAAFTIQTRGRIGKSPDSKIGSTASGEENHEPTLFTGLTKRFTPLVLAGAIGGIAVLVFGLATLVVCFIAFNRSNQPVAKATETKAGAPAQIVENQAAGDPDANPPQVAPDTNPELPAIPGPGAPTEEKPAVATAPADVNPLPPEPAIAPPPAAAPAAVAAKTETPAEEKPVATEPPVAKVASVPAKPTATPAKKAVTDPFMGFAKAVSLPPLPESADDATPSDLKPISLGPCNGEGDVPLTISLIGGDTAIRAAKQKFELQPRAMNPREWEITLSGGAAPVTVASLAAKDKELQFQWTEEAIKQAASAKQLVNCALVLGKTKHIAALRTPIKGQPLVFDLDKAGAAVKWNLRDLPLAKQVFIEVTKTEGFTRQRLEPKTPVNVGESVVVGTGPSNKSVPLLLKLNTASNANTVDVRLQTTVKVEGWLEPRAYRKKDLVAMQPLSVRELEGITADLKKVKNSRPNTKEETAAKDAAIQRLANEQAARNILLDQLRYVVDFSGMTEGVAKIHFRVYHVAGETKIDLLRTEDPEDSEK